MTLQMAIGKMIVEKIVGRPDKYPKEVVDAAGNVVGKLPEWRANPKRRSYHEDRWHINSQSWKRFKEAAREHNISLPEVLQEEQ